MKIIEVHSDAYAHLREAEFSFRSSGLWWTYYCRRLDTPGPRIRKAGALQVRAKVIPGLWVFSTAKDQWTLYNGSAIPANAVGSIPHREVYWARAWDLHRRGRQFDTYGSEITR